MKRMLFITLLTSVLFTFPTMSKAQEGTWTLAQDRPSNGAMMASAVVDGKIYTIGGMCLTGCGSGNWGSREVNAYDVAADTWEQRDLMPDGTGRARARAAAVDGVIYVFGGSSERELPAPLPTALAYDAATDTWTDKADLPAPVQAPGVIGGYDVCRACLRVDGDEGVSSTSVYEYDPVSDTYTPKQDMPTPRGPGATAVFEGKIYVFGGIEPQLGDARLDVVEVYDPAIDAWTAREPMPSARGEFGVAVVHDKIYVIGGEENVTDVLDRVDIYDPTTDTWVVDQAPALVAPRSQLSVEVVNDKIMPWEGGMGAA